MADNDDAAASAATPSLRRWTDLIAGKRFTAAETATFAYHAKMQEEKSHPGTERAKAARLAGRAWMDLAKKLHSILYELGPCYADERDQTASGVDLDARYSALSEQVEQLVAQVPQLESTYGPLDPVAFMESFEATARSFYPSEIGSTSMYGFPKMRFVKARTAHEKKYEEMKSDAEAAAGASA